MNRRDMKVQSIHNMMSLLVSIEANPDKFIDDDKIITIISSQSSLAKASLPKDESDKSIFPMSLNTQKTLCRMEFIEGYRKIDNQRLKAKASINRIKNKSKVQKIERTLNTNEFNQKLMIENSLYIQIIDKLRGELKKALLTRPDHPEDAFESINKIINLQLQHVKKFTDVKRLYDC